MNKTSTYTVNNDIVTVRIEKRDGTTFISEQASFKTDNEDLKLAIKHYNEACEGINSCLETLAEPIDKKDWNEVNNILNDMKALMILAKNFEGTIITLLKKSL